MKPDNFDFRKMNKVVNEAIEAGTAFRMAYEKLSRVMEGFYDNMYPFYEIESTLNDIDNIQNLTEEIKAALNRKSN